MDKLKRRVSQLFVNVTDANSPFKKDGDVSKYAVKSRSKQNQIENAKKPNSHYNDMMIFEEEDGVRCIKVIDHGRIAVGLETGKVAICDILLGRRLAVLHNHQSAINNLEVVACVGGYHRLISACTDGLITHLWDLDTSEMMKCFILTEDPFIRLMHHIPHQQYPSQLNFLFGHSKLQLCHIYIHQLQDPVCPQVIGRTNAGDNILKFLESSTRIICVAEMSVDVFGKEWDAKGRLKLTHLDIPLVSDNPLYSSATLLSDTMFAVGTTYGGVYICKLDEKVEPDFYNPFVMDTPVKDLSLLTQEWLLVVYEKSIHIVYRETGQSEYTQVFSNPLLAVRHIPTSSLLVSLTSQNDKLLTWDISDIVHDAKVWSRDEPHLLSCSGSLLAHDDLVKGIEVAECGPVTFSKDSLVIVWKNKNEEMLRLFKSVQEKDSNF